MHQSILQDNSASDDVNAHNISNLAKHDQHRLNKLANRETRIQNPRQALGG